MISLTALAHQNFAPADLPAAVRAALGKPLRRAAPLTQLALVATLACIPPERRHLPTALLWQSTSGPRLETLTLLEEICNGTAEPMPYDFLATQPAIAAAQIQTFVPGLQSAMHLPLDSEGAANWSLLLALAVGWLNEGRFDQVLCAQFDTWETRASHHCLTLNRERLEKSLATLHLTDNTAGAHLPDTPNLPTQLADWLAHGTDPTCAVQAPAAMRQAVEFARI